MGIFGYLKDHEQQLNLTEDLNDHVAGCPRRIDGVGGLLRHPDPVFRPTGVLDGSWSLWKIGVHLDPQGLIYW